MKKVYEAYDVFAATNEWPRDYIYYGLTPQQPKDLSIEILRKVWCILNY